MGQKVHPYGFRIGINKTWRSRWYAGKKYAELLHEDLELRRDLKRRLGLTYLFIAHNLAVVRHMSDRVAVMYLGRIVELADREEIYSRPLHPYTEALLSAVPVPDPVVEASRQRIRLEGEIPSPTAEIQGCPFRARCPRAFERCAVEAPRLKQHAAGHQAACHLPEEE